ncbi:MAG: cobalamin biosynthesis protein [Anaerolineae bacterium]
MAVLRELGRRGTVGAMSLLADMLVQRWPDRWSDVGTSLAGLSLARAAQHIPGSLGLWAEAAILSTALGMHRTRVDATELARCLDGGDPAGVRRTGARLMGRDTGTLSEAQIAAQSAEAIATATADGVIAPLFYYLVGGLPGVMAYQLVGSGGLVLGADGQRLLRRMRLIPRRVADGLGLATRRLAERCPACASDALEQSSDSSAIQVRKALDQMRASVAVTGGALVLLSALTRIHARPVHHLETKG